MKNFFVFLLFGLWLFAADAYIISSVGNVSITRFSNAKTENIAVDIANVSQKDIDRSKKILGTQSFRLALENSKDPSNPSYEKAIKFLNRTDIKNSMETLRKISPVILSEQDIIVTGNNSFALIKINKTNIKLGSGSRLKIFGLGATPKLQLTSGICHIDASGELLFRTRTAMFSAMGQSVVAIGSTRDSFANISGEFLFLDDGKQTELKAGFSTKADLSKNRQKQTRGIDPKPFELPLKPLDAPHKTYKKGDYEWNYM
ncbi:MAG: hypothetical protein ACTTIC_08485 [Helicobacteraceae bacterium]